MVESDVLYVDECLEAGCVQSPCLELGVGYDGPQQQATITGCRRGILRYRFAEGERCRLCHYFEDPSELIEEKLGNQKFGSILLLSVLEHTFEPIRILDNAINILRSKGTSILITPVIWPLHDYPNDCWRINPNFYEEYCNRRSLVLLEDHFKYVGFHEISRSRTEEGAYLLPAPSQSKSRTLRSRFIHRLFDTYGRGMAFPSHVAIGAVIQKPC
jgi:hypothetical protein